MTWNVGVDRVPVPELPMVTSWVAGLPAHTPDMLAVTLVGESVMVGEPKAHEVDARSDNGSRIETIRELLTTNLLTASKFQNEALERQSFKF